MDLETAYPLTDPAVQAVAGVLFADSALRGDVTLEHLRAVARNLTRAADDARAAEEHAAAVPPRGPVAVAPTLAPTRPTTAPADVSGTLPDLDDLPPLEADDADPPRTEA